MYEYNVKIYIKSSYCDEDTDGSYRRFNDECECSNIYRIKSRNKTDDETLERIAYSKAIETGDSELMYYRDCIGPEIESYDRIRNSTLNICPGETIEIAFSIEEVRNSIVEITI